jgi:hypothetical protein
MVLHKKKGVAEGFRTIFFRSELFLVGSAFGYSTDQKKVLQRSFF